MTPETINILIVDDDPAGQRLAISTMLKSDQAACFAVQIADTLAETLKLLDSTDFDLVLLNVMLPDCQGLQTVDEVCMAHPRLPVLVLADLANEHIAVRSVKIGASDYLVKDDQFQSLLVPTINYALQRSKNPCKLPNARD